MCVENKSYGIKTICIDPLSTCCCTSRHKQFILSECGPQDESRTSHARRKGMSRRTEQDRVVKDKSGEDNPGSSHVRGNMQYCRRK
jgi:hypothetical protein